MPQSDTDTADRLSALVSPPGAGVLFLLILVARALATSRGYFYEGDEISIAAGVAQLLNGDLGPFYQYPPLLGYYRLVQGLSLLLGGVEHIHTAMLVLSSLAGAAIPVAALGLFKAELWPRIRVLAAAVLVANPTLWMASQYGNAAVVSVAFVALGTAVLSNRGGGARLAFGLILYSLGVFVRADAVLAAPMIAYLVYRNVGALRATLVALGTAAVLGAATYALLFLADPAMGGLGDGVTQHFQDDYATHFFEYLMWAFSPFVLAFIILGGHEGLGRRDPLLWLLLLGVLPAFGFYFSATTTPRYFLLSVLPLSVLAAWGMDGVARLSAGGRRLGAWALVLSFGFVHLVVGLGEFTATPFSDRFKAPGFGTHDSEMPTGALLYQAYLNGGLFGRSIRGPEFGSSSELAQSLEPALATLARGDGPRRVSFLFHSWNGHAAAYHIAVAGGRVIGGAEQNGYVRPVLYRLGETTMTLQPYAPGIVDPPADLGLSRDDEVWLLRPLSNFPDPGILGALSPGDTLTRISPTGDYLEVFRVTNAQGLAPGNDGRTPNG